MRAAATSRVWMDGVERIVLDVLRRHPLSLLSRVNERKDTGWFYERIAIQGVSVRQRAPRTVHCTRIYYEYSRGYIRSICSVKWNRRAVPLDCLALLPALYAAFFFFFLPISFPMRISMILTAWNSKINKGSRLRIKLRVKFG